MFIHQPYDFGRIHRRTAAKCDNNVRLQITDNFQCAFDCCRIRIRIYVGKDLVRNAQFFQNAGDFIGITQPEQRLVRNDKGFFLAFQLP